MANNEVLSLRLANKVCTDFYPLELTLTEGLAELFRGELTVLSDKKHTPKDLQDLLDKGATVTVTENQGGGKTRSRYLHGIVTKAAACGLIATSPDANPCYVYKVVVEPELARLCYAVRHRPFYRKTPTEVIKEVITPYGISADFAGIRLDFCSKLLFEQHGVSDYDFIRALMSIYGLSFTHVHGAVGADALGQAKLSFLDGNTIPAPDGGGTVSLDFIKSDAGNVIKMDAWTMKSGIGVDGIALSTVYPNENYGSGDWKKGKIDLSKGERFLEYNRLFTSYDQAASNDEIDADIELALAAKLRAAELAKTAWTGKAAAIALSPGSILGLAHYYGPKDGDTITALVTASALEARAPWPQQLAINPDSSFDHKDTVTVTFTAMDYGKDAASRRFCPVTKGKE